MLPAASEYYVDSLSYGSQCADSDRAEPRVLVLVIAFSRKAAAGFILREEDTFVYFMSLFAKDTFLSLCPVGYLFACLSLLVPVSMNHTQIHYFVLSYHQITMKLATATAFLIFGEHKIKPVRHPHHLWINDLLISAMTNDLSYFPCLSSLSCYSPKLQRGARTSRSSQLTCASNHALLARNVFCPLPKSMVTKLTRAF